MDGRPEQLVVVGHIRRPHGVRGEMIVEVLSDTPDRFRPGAVLDVVLAKGAKRTVEITAVRPHRGELLVHFSGIDDREGASELRDASVVIAGDQVPPPPSGSYYYYQLLGCRCRDRSAGAIGRVTEVVEDGGGLLLVVDDGERQVMIPFVRDYIEEIDLSGQVIDLDLPPGLLESCASP